MKRTILRGPIRGACACAAMFAALVLTALAPRSSRAQSAAVASYRREVQPLLTKYCYGCHAGGEKNGGVAFDTLTSDAAILKTDLWWRVLKNVRAELMPPHRMPKPNASERSVLHRWITHEAFGLDPRHPDPGRVTLRRLNRVEYRNTIRELLQFEFNTDEEFPPDDSGYGFDNIGEVLSVSPLLLEKYLQAAETIVAAAVPTVPRVVREVVVEPGQFQSLGPERIRADRMSFYQPASLRHDFTVATAGDYRLTLDLDVAGQFDFDPGRCRVTLKVDGDEQERREFGWHSNKRFRLEFVQSLPAGAHQYALELLPLEPVEKRKNSLDLRLVSLQVQGPLDPKHWIRPRNYDRIFFRGEAPEDTPGRRQYARDVLRAFATRAFRRPVEEALVERLATLAESVYHQPGRRFEHGIAQALVPVLASPRFVFRVEGTLPTTEPHVLLDEYALASRLSYFLWSSMPDDTLFQLAQRGELRRNLRAQVLRMLQDPRAQQFMQNFIGQWLQARDLDGIALNERAILARDRDEPLGFGFRFAQRPPIELDRELRRALRRESELLFGYLIEHDRSVTELVDCDYTFVNERLARHYGLPGVSGPELRRVTLPPDSPRGGVLTQGALLIVTSNPTRTSAVKRGQFILDNLLGSPAPPPPPDIPELEAAAKEVVGRRPTVRELMELHRSKPLCRSCHARMDPLGLALENFNALGMYREKEFGQPVDASGQLITGEPFKNVRDLKRILTQERRADFYRCLTEKLLTYALGRGTEHTDVLTVDEIVARLERENGKFSALLFGVIESAPFQKTRRAAG